VWADNNGRPAAQPLATQTAVLPNPLPANTPGLPFFEVAFAAPVSVSGRFYVGFGQASSGQFLPYGFDLNPGTAPTLFVNTQNTWTTATLSTPGALMVRAVMNNNVLSANASRAVSAGFALFPNPALAGTVVSVSGPAFTGAALLDVLGRELWRQPAAEAGRTTWRLTARLPSGVYLVRLTLPGGEVATRRLVISE